MILNIESTSFFLLAVLAKVTSPMRVRNNMAYLLNFEVETKRVFHQRHTHFHVGNNTLIFTPRTKALCNAFVKKNTLYLLGGNVKRDKVYITSCDLAKKWKSLNKFTRKSLRKNRFACNCAITGCHGTNCVLRVKGQSETNSCQHSSPFIKNCYEKYAVCTFRQGVCQWSKPTVGKLRRCLKVDKKAWKVQRFKFKNIKARVPKIGKNN